jgi:hypothetical protein
LNLEIIDDIAHAIYATRQLFGSAFLVGRLHDSVQRHHSQIGIDIDTGEISGFVSH